MGKVIEYKPETEGFEGYIKIDMPSYSERLKCLKDINFKVKDGQVAASSDGIETLLGLLDVAKPRVKEISIKFNGETYTTWDELDQNCGDLLNEIASLVMNGEKLGKS